MTHLRSTLRPGLTRTESDMLVWTECGEQMSLSIVDAATCTCQACATTHALYEIVDTASA